MTGAPRAADSVIAAAKNVFATNVIATCGESARVRPEELDRRLQRSGCGGHWTAVIVAVDGEHVAGSSGGDSVAWLCGSDGAVDLTDRQHRKPLVGWSNASAVAFTDALHGRRALVASDGLWKYASATRIRETVLSNDERVAARLVDLVRLSTGAVQDDVSIAVVTGYRYTA